jgi:hypothetical protein
MKIGDVEIKKIPQGERVDCQGCSATAVSYRNGVPYCADCLLTEQEKAWKNEISFVNPDGEVVSYQIRDLPRNKK